MNVIWLHGKDSVSLQQQFLEILNELCEMKIIQKVGNLRVKIWQEEDPEFVRALIRCIPIFVRNGKLHKDVLTKTLAAYDDPFVVCSLPSQEVCDLETSSEDSEEEEEEDQMEEESDHEDVCEQFIADLVQQSEFSEESSSLEGEDSETSWEEELNVAPLKKEDPFKRRAETEQMLVHMMETYGIPRDWYWCQPIRTMEGEVIEYSPSPTLVGGMPDRRKNRRKNRSKVPRKKRRRMPMMKVVGCPDKHIQSLRYPVLKLINSVASGSSAVRFVTNGVWDVDPTLGSTSTPFFAEWTAMYSYYRVIKFKMELHLTNNEAVPVEFEIVHSNTDPGTTGLNFLQYANASYNKVLSLAASTAQPAKTVRSALSPKRLVGDRAVFTEQNFWGSSSSNPVDLTYVGLGCQINAGNLTNGVYVTGFIEFLVEFFDRKNLQSSFLKRVQPYDPQEVLRAQMNVEQAEKMGKKVEASDQQVIDAMVQWRKELADDPQEKEIRRRLCPYVRAPN